MSPHTRNGCLQSVQPPCPPLPRGTLASCKGKHGGLPLQLHIGRNRGLCNCAIELAACGLEFAARSHRRLFRDGDERWLLQYALTGEVAGGTVIRIERIKRWILLHADLLAVWAARVEPAAVRRA